MYSYGVRANPRGGYGVASALPIVSGRPVVPPMDGVLGLAFVPDIRPDCIS